jgi:uncharacterized NAD-dependent epimerase/dehydratase family protein
MKIHEGVDLIMNLKEEISENQIKEVIKVCEENNVTMDEVKEISNELNYRTNLMSEMKKYWSESNCTS